MDLGAEPPIIKFWEDHSLVEPCARGISNLIVIWSTVARQENNFDSDVVPERKLARRLALVELNCLPNLIQKFDSVAVLLPCFCRT